jgi:recombination protein RecA
MKEKYSIEKLVEKAKKKFGKDASTFDDLEDINDIKGWISTGIPELNLLLQTQGIPPGITEMAGNPQSGKTTSSLHFVREVQAKGGLPIVISTERRDSKIYAQTLGVKTDQALIFKAKNIEAIFAKIEDAVGYMRQLDKHIPIAIIVDSLGGTPAKAELTSDADQEFMAVAAKVIKKGLRRVTQLLDEYNAILWMNNQTYDKVGRFFGKKSVAYGGKGMQFHSQIRMEIVRIGNITIDKVKIGQTSKIDLLKCDFSAPLRSCLVDILFGYGMIPSQDMLKLGLEFGILDEYKKKGYQVIKIPKYKWKSKAKYYRMCMEDTTFRMVLKNMFLMKVNNIVKNMRTRQKFIAEKNQ